MATYLSDIVGEVGAALDLDVSPGSDGETSLIRYANWAGRRIYSARPWRERRVETIITTLAPYTTGTVTLTNASTAVTGSGTTWTAAMSGRKIALGYGQPWYRFTRTGNTTGTIAQAYAESTATDSTYVLYQDEFDVDASMDVVSSASLLYLDGRMTGLSEGRMDGSAYVHGAVGLPRYYSLTNSTTDGTKRVRVWPVPDQAYRIRVNGFKEWEDMSTLAAAWPLSDNLARVWFKATCLEGQALSDAPRKTSEGEVEELIERVWRDLQDSVPRSYHRQSFDATTREYGTWLDSTNAFP